MTTLAELRGSRELILNLTLRELRGKYKRSLLGWTWSLLNPLATMAIFTVVFSYLLKVQMPPGRPSGLDSFPLALLIGLLPWNFLANSLNGSMDALIGNANLIKKVYFAREALVIANVGAWVVAFLIEMTVLSIALLIAGNFVLPWLVPVLVIALIQTMFVIGIGLALSVLNVYFRDVQHLMNIVLQLWFYATPIVYPITLVAERDTVIFGVKLLTLYRLDPMVRFIEAYRNCLYDLRLPAAGDMVYLLVVSVAALVAGLAIFARLEPKLAEEL